VLRKSGLLDILIVIYYISFLAACLEIVVNRTDLGRKEEADRDILWQGVD